MGANVGAGDQLGMAKERRGSIRTRKDGSIWARVTYVGNDGKRHELQRRAENRTQARFIIKGLLAELEERGDRGLDGQRMTFKELAAYYKEHKLIPAEYHGARKVAGLRAYKTPQGFLEVLVGCFGGKRIRDITHADLESFKRARLKQPVTRKVKNKAGEWVIVKTDKVRAIASVNRELETMRAVMGFAKRQRWISDNPFSEGQPLISKADENRRERVLTFAEEQRLLEVCANQRAHLKPLVITALDTGMRRGELLKLRWREVDLETQNIIVTAMNSKTARARTIAMTPRVHEELSRLWKQSPKDPKVLVFGIVDTVKRSWSSACEKAKITEIRFHDLRHTALTRMIQAGILPLEVMKISGHTQMTTFTRYINPTTEAVQHAADRLAAFNAAAFDILNTNKEQSSSRMIN